MIHVRGKSPPLLAYDAKKLTPASIGVGEDSAVALLTPEDRLIFAAVRSVEQEFDFHPLWWRAEGSGLVYESYRYGESHPPIGQIRLSVDWGRRAIEVYENQTEMKSANTVAFISRLEQRIRETDPDATVSSEAILVQISSVSFK